MSSMMDSSKNTTAGKKAPSTGQEKPLYIPLQLYHTLMMSSADLYSAFLPYVLTYEQLRSYEFPLGSPNHPTRRATDSTQRCCVRCRATFYILDDGTYKSEVPCRFHTKKLTSPNGAHAARTYECCNGNSMSEGCATWHFHVTAERSPKDVKYVETRKKRHLNREESHTVYALDCEMCYTTGGLEVAKIGIVGIDGLRVYESFVLPKHQILDYNTVYSGITENHLKDVSTTLVDVQIFLLKLLNKDSILVGHGLENDLKALGLMHNKVVDTSIVFPHKYVKKYKRSLKSLALEYLNKSIQDNTSGHDSIEDARTCLELMLWKINSDNSNRYSLRLHHHQLPMRFSKRQDRFFMNRRHGDFREPAVDHHEFFNNVHYPKNHSRVDYEEMCAHCSRLYDGVHLRTAAFNDQKNFHNVHYRKNHSRVDYEEICPHSSRPYDGVHLRTAAFNDEKHVHNVHYPRNHSWVDYPYDDIDYEDLHYEDRDYDVDYEELCRRYRMM